MSTYGVRQRFPALLMQFVYKGGNMAGILGNVQLKVTPEQLNAKAGEVEKSVKRMKDEFENMKILVEKSGAYWVGEAGDFHRKKYMDQVETIDTILKLLGEHPGDLRTIAQTYAASELMIETRIETLPGDIL